MKLYCVRPNAENVVWVSKDPAIEVLYRLARSRKWLPDPGIRIEYLCPEGFERLTGIRLNAGESCVLEVRHL